MRTPARHADPTPPTADARLAQWVADVAPDVRVDWAAPSDAPADGPAIRIHQLALFEQSRSRARGAGPLELIARYLLTAAAPSPTTANAVLVELAFEAVGLDWLTLHNAPPGLDLWRAAGLMPRPALVIDVPIRRARPPHPVGRVLEPPIVHIADLAGVAGVVIGPGAVPVVGAEVELRPLDRLTRTDARGAFAFAATPADGAQLSLVIRARGRRLVVPLDPDASDRTALRVEFDPSEE